MKKFVLSTLIVLFPSILFAIGPITGTLSLCAGTTGTLTDTTTGGTWSSGNTTVATIGTTGMLDAVAAGTAIITYSAGGAHAYAAVTVAPAPAAISGSTTICTGYTATESDITSGGTWTIHDTSLATIGTATGIVTAIEPGYTAITYTLPTGCYTTAPIAIYRTPPPLSEEYVCEGAHLLAADTVAYLGGVWSIENRAVVNIVGTDLVGVSAGTTIVTFLTSPGCFSAFETVVIPPFTETVGPLSICTGRSAAFTDSLSGGTWTSGNTSVGIIGYLSGSFTAVAPGTTIISYSLGAGCVQTHEAIVDSSPSAITGVRSICNGSFTTLTDSIAGGVWSASGTAIAIGSTGIVTGLSPGTAVVTYKISDGCIAADTVTVNVMPPPISGPSTICDAGEGLETDGITGGTWSSSNPGVASIGLTDGWAGGVAVGTTHVTYTISGGCYAVRTMTVAPRPEPITAPASICAGVCDTLFETGGGVWESSDASVAGIGSSSGLLCGVGAGTALLMYTISTGCLTIDVITVNNSPGPVTGPSGVCAGATATEADVTPGGIWTSSNSAAASVSGGTVTGAGTGTAVITYKLGDGCMATKQVTVFPTPLGIFGPHAACLGSVTLMISVPPSGEWTSSNTSVASIGSSSGSLTGIAVGTSVITYELPGGCYYEEIFAISPSPGPITIASPVICTGFTETLGNSVSGGVWQSSNTAVAVVGSLTGILTGATAGTAVVTYTLGSGCTAARQVTVLNAPAPFAGPRLICAGTAGTLTDADTGGSWTSSRDITAPISTTGIYTGVAAGTTMITYTLPGGCYYDDIVRVTPLPGPIAMSVSALCSGSSALVFDTVSGGAWLSSNTSVAAIGSATGIITGLSAGTTIVTYMIDSGCMISRTIIADSGAAPITGVNVLCLGAATTLSDATAGGTWSASGTAISIGSTGVVTAVSTGTATVTYKIPDGCTATGAITVDPLPTPISGPSILCAGSTGLETDGVTGGTWSSGNLSVIAIGSSGLTAGVVSAITSGTTEITYTITGGCFAIKSMTAIPRPGPITGPDSICSGICSTLLESGAGVWESSNSSVASVGSASGLLCGIGTGTAMLTYTVAAGCFVTESITVDTAPGPVTGHSNLCAGTTTTEADAAPGGAWTSSDTAVATIGAASGLLTGISSGTSSITYALPDGCYTQRAVAITSSPGPISGKDIRCIGSHFSFDDTTSGGTWSSSVPTVSTINAATGMAAGVGSGTSVISYTLPDGCYAAGTLRILPPPSAISGPSHICAGTTIAYTDSEGYGNWLSSDTAIATISGSGMLVGAASGTTIITYMIDTGCEATRYVRIYSMVGNIEGANPACAATTATLSDTVTGGTWSSANTAVGTIGQTNGIFSAIATGTTIISYTIGGSCVATRTESVIAAPPAITAPPLICDTATLTDSIGGGLWSSGNTLVATIGSAAGSVAGVSAGTVAITYSLYPGCLAERVVDISFAPAAAAVTGTTSQCAGDSTRLADSAAGGYWTSSDSTVATVTPATGEVTGVGYGTCSITYTLSDVCGTSEIVVRDTVWALPFADTIVGTDSVCPGDSIVLTDSIITGVWATSDSSVATVSPWGTVTGVSAGTANISFTVATPCGSASAVATIRVNSGMTCDNAVPHTPNTANAAMSLTIEPNPNTGIFEIAGTVTGNLDITITDMTGRQLYARAIKPVNGKVADIVTIGSYVPNGVYLLSCSDGRNTQIFRIIVLK